MLIFLIVSFCFSCFTCCTVKISDANLTTIQVIQVFIGYLALHGLWSRSIRHAVTSKQHLVRKWVVTHMTNMQLFCIKPPSHSLHKQPMKTPKLPLTNKNPTTNDHFTVNTLKQFFCLPRTLPSHLLIPSCLIQTRRTPLTPLIR